MHEVDLAQINENIDKVEFQISRLQIRSPIQGFVKGLKVKTIGGIVEGGGVITEIIPISGNLLAEVRIKPKDIGHVKLGQYANVKITSYDFSRYGTVRGVLEHISANTFFDSENHVRYYLGKIRLEKNFLGNNSRENIIFPGMTLQSEIVTGSKSILSYLIKPIYSNLSQSFKER